jgi:hypothetical protein
MKFILHMLLQLLKKVAGNFSKEMTRYEVLHSVLQKYSRETSSLTKKHPASDIHEKNIAISTVIGKQLSVLRHSVELLCLPTCSF